MVTTQLTQNQTTFVEEVDSGAALRHGLLEADASMVMQMTLGYQSSLDAIERETKKLLTQYEKDTKAGNDVSATWMYEAQRLQALEAMVRKEVSKFGADALDIATRGQQSVIDETLKNFEKTTLAKYGPKTIRRADGGVNAAFVGVNRPAMENLVGRLSDGTRLNAQHFGISEDVWQSMQATLVGGLATGANSDVIAAKLRSAANMPRYRAIALARTEMFNAHRDASTELFRDNADLVQGWIWDSGADGRTCAVCWSKHGSKHGLETSMRSHPSCRCAQVPWFIDENEKKLNRKWPDGKKLFKQSLNEKQQRKILGVHKFDLWKKGVIQLDDLVGTRNSSRWGRSLYEKSISQLKTEGFNLTEKPSMMRRKLSRREELSYYNIQAPLQAEWETKTMQKGYKFVSKHANGQDGGGRLVAKELMKDPKAIEFIKEYGSFRGFKIDRDNLTDQQLEDAFHEWTISMAGTWNGSSGDSDARALRTQFAAKAEFNTPHNVEPWPADVVKNIKSKIKPGKSQHEEFLLDRKVLRAQWQVTQNQLSAEGLTHITLVRGVKFSSYTPYEPQWSKDWTAGSTDRSNFQSVSEIHSPELAPLSSYSTDPARAASFASSGEIGYVMAVRVPISQIVSTGESGLGTHYEHEFVVLDGLGDQVVTPVTTFRQYNAPVDKDGTIIGQPNLKVKIPGMFGAPAYTPPTYGYSAPSYAAPTPAKPTAKVLGEAALVGLPTGFAQPKMADYTPVEVYTEANLKATYYMGDVLAKYDQIAYKKNAKDFHVLTAADIDGSFDPVFVAGPGGVPPDHLAVKIDGEAYVKLLNEWVNKWGESAQAWPDGKAEQFAMAKVAAGFTMGSNVSKAVSSPTKTTLLEGGHAWMVVPMDKVPLFTPAPSNVVPPNHSAYTPVSAPITSINTGGQAAPSHLTKTNAIFMLNELDATFNLLNIPGNAKLNGYQVAYYKIMGANPEMAQMFKIQDIDAINNLVTKGLLDSIEAKFIKNGGFLHTKPYGDNSAVNGGAMATATAPVVGTPQGMLPKPPAGVIVKIDPNDTVEDLTNKQKILDAQVQHGMLATATYKAKSKAIAKAIGSGQHAIDSTHKTQSASNNDAVATQLGIPIFPKPPVYEVVKILPTDTLEDLKNKQKMLQAQVQHGMIKESSYKQKISTFNAAIKKGKFAPGTPVQPVASVPVNPTPIPTVIPIPTTVDNSGVSGDTLVTASTYVPDTSMPIEGWLTQPQQIALSDLFEKTYGKDIMTVSNFSTEMLKAKYMILGSNKKIAKGFTPIQKAEIFDLYSNQTITFQDAQKINDGEFKHPSITKIPPVGVAPLTPKMLLMQSPKPKTMEEAKAYVAAMDVAFNTGLITSVEWNNQITSDILNMSKGLSPIAPAPIGQVTQTQTQTQTVNTVDVFSLPFPKSAYQAENYIDAVVTAYDSGQITANGMASLLPPIVYDLKDGFVDDNTKQYVENAIDLMALPTDKGEAIDYWNMLTDAKDDGFIAQPFFDKHATSKIQALAKGPDAITQTMPSVPQSVASKYTHDGVMQHPLPTNYLDASQYKKMIDDAVDMKVITIDEGVSLYTDEIKDFSQGVRTIAVKKMVSETLTKLPTPKTQGEAKAYVAAWNKAVNDKLVTEKSYDFWVDDIMVDMAKNGPSSANTIGFVPTPSPVVVSPVVPTPKSKKNAMPDVIVDSGTAPDYIVVKLEATDTLADIQKKLQMLDLQSKYNQVTPVTYGQKKSTLKTAIKKGKYVADVPTITTADATPTPAAVTPDATVTPATEAAGSFVSPPVQPVSVPAPVAAAVPQVVQPMTVPFTHISELTYQGPKPGGSASGQLMTDTNGDTWLVKVYDKAEQAANEVLASKLYELAGADVPTMYEINMDDTFPGKAKIGVASRWVDEGVKDIGSSNAATKKLGQVDFAADAWLANWDVVGLNYENIAIGKKSGKAYRIDPGGALLYRAMGGLKGDKFFNKNVVEWDTLRSSTNVQAKTIFGDMTDAEMVTSAKRVLKVSDEDIRTAVMQYGPGTILDRSNLADLMIERKNNLAEKAQAANGGLPVFATPVSTTVTESSAPAVAPPVNPPVPLTPTQTPLVTPTPLQGAQPITNPVQTPQSQTNAPAVVKVSLDPISGSSIMSSAHAIAYQVQSKKLLKAKAAGWDQQTETLILEYKAIIDGYIATGDVKNAQKFMTHYKSAVKDASHGIVPQPVPGKTASSSIIVTSGGVGVISLVVPANPVFIAPVPAAKAPTSPNPSGVSPLDTISLPVHKKTADVGQHALQAVGSVHTVTGIPMVALQKPSAYEKDQNITGKLKIQKNNNQAKYIAIDPDATGAQTTMVHEYGHLIEHTVLKKYETDPILKAIAGTQTYKELVQKSTGTANDYFSYLSQRHEAFARAYAQYVAIKSGDQTLLSQLYLQQQSSLGTAWKNDEFEPIMDEFDALFKAKGWIV